MREARRAFRRVACAMTRASACGSSWLSVESRRVALATIATPSRADAPRRRPVAAVRHAIAAEAPATHWAGRQKARAALASATRLMSESDRASFAAYDVEFVVEISRCRAPLHRSTTEALSPAADVELYSSTALQSALHLYSSTALYTLHPLHPPSGPALNDHDGERARAPKRRERRRAPPAPWRGAVVHDAAPSMLYHASHPQWPKKGKNFTTKLPRTTLGTGLARTGTNTGTPREPPKRLLRGRRGT